MHSQFVNMVDATAAAAGCKQAQGYIMLTGTKTSQACNSSLLQDKATARHMTKNGKVVGYQAQEQRETTDAATLHTNKSSNHSTYYKPLHRAVLPPLHWTLAAV